MFWARKEEQMKKEYFYSFFGSLLFTWKKCYEINPITFSSYASITKKFSTLQDKIISSAWWIKGVCQYQN